MFDLKSFRKDQKINQATLAKRLGVGQPFISQIESGKDPMPASLVDNLSALFVGLDMTKYEGVEVNGGAEMPSNELIGIIKSQQETINRQSKIIESLTSK